MPGFIKVIRSMIPQTQSVKEDDIVILIVGTAGSGKTSFVEKVTKKEIFNVRSGLASGSKGVSCVPFKPENEISRIVLADTPPYPDGEGDKVLLAWLAKKKRPPIMGIIYFHPITANRGWPDENFVRFRQQSGCELRRAPAILVTTHWRGREGETRYLDRHRDISNKWALKVQESTWPTPVVYDETIDSARGIIQNIIDTIGRRV